jgi:hypothetical protein
MDDAEWAFFEPFLMAIRGRGGRPRQITGLCWMVCFGLQERARNGVIYRRNSVNGRVFTGNSGVGRFPACGSWF